MARQITMRTLDGVEATAHVAYMFTEFAGIYPITPSTGMGELTDQWASEGRKNMWGQVVKVVEMQSEAGAIGTVHGALQGGALSATYTASQGLLLMIPDLYKLKGQLLPGVIHVSARALAHRSLSIFGDHQDVYACRQIGIPMVCSHSVQETMDLAGVAHAIAIEASVPVIHFFDGFRTSHEFQKIEMLSDAEAQSLVNQEKVREFRARALQPNAPQNRGGAENDDIYFQGVEAQNNHFANVVNVADKIFTKISEITGREYAPFTYYGHDQATEVIVAMGSVTETIKETIDTLNAKGGKYGLVKVHLFRPFSVSHLKSVIPSTTKKIAVMDRTKEIGSTGEPLYLDVVAALQGTDIKIVGGRYGLSSKNTAPRHIKAVFDNLGSKQPKNGFTVGINDDVTHLSLSVDETFTVDRDYSASLFYGLGSDGTVGANKNTVKIIGDSTNNYAQAYFQYDSKKSGGVTRSHLRFGKSPLRSTYYVEDANFIACSVESYLFKFDMVGQLGKGGTFLLNTTVPADKIEEFLPANFKKSLAQKEANLYIINASGIAREIGMGNRTNTILQSAFFYLNPQILPYETANEMMKKFALKSYAKKGQELVELNYKAIDSATTALVKVDVKASWAKLDAKMPSSNTGDLYFDEFVGELAALRGDEMPVSKFTDKPGGFDILDGSFRNNVTAKERRQVSDVVPTWIPENCIACNKCAMVCPHATIRAFALTQDEVNAAPTKTLATIKAAGFDGYEFRIQVDPENCVGCALCVKECPGKAGAKALKMVDTKQEVEKEAANVAYMYKNHKLYRGNQFGADTPRGAAMLYPYFEGSGACGGCGETPYYRLATQFFGDSMTIANATGCSSIYCGSTPASPFATNERGEGPAWANSLFEDNAEFGAGMNFANNFRMNRIKEIMEANMETVEPGLKDLFTKWIAAGENRKAQRDVKEDIITMIKASNNNSVKQILDITDGLVKKSQWIIGGDGWAYDIGYGGLDHVMASGEDVNILILDTEMYSNTGGQSSKSSQAASIAKFTAIGKELAKKNLPAIAMTYQNVYVASVAMGANSAQTIKALKEAESYKGVSIVIAYAPCISHGLKGGLMNHQAVQRNAVEVGYWNIFRFDPRLIAQGKNPLQIDFANPNFDNFKSFLLNETRYSNLPKLNPANAERLYEKSKADAMKRFAYLQGLATSSAFGGKAAASNDPVANITSMLPGFNCNACQSGSCEGLAKDIVAGTKTADACVPAKPEAKAKIAEAMAK